MLMLLAKEPCDFERCGCGTSIMKRNGRDRIGEEKGLTHVSLLLELFKVRKDTFPNRKCRVLKTANRSCSPPLGRSLGHIGDTRHHKMHV